MNPDPSFWFQSFGRLAVGGIALVGLGMLAARWGKSAAWPRAVWQACLTGLLLLLGFELTGAGRELWPRGGADEVPRSARTVIATTETVNTGVATARPESVTLRVSPEHRPNPVRASAGNAAWAPGLVWLAGVAILMLRGGFARVWLTFAWRRRPRHAITDGPLWGRAQALAHRLNLRTAPLAEVEDLPGPVAYGLVRPTICVPKHFTADFTPTQQDAMLAHELAHAAAHDPAWYGLADFVSALWWWHPLVWWARRQLRETSESAADEVSVLLEDGPGALAESLVAVGRRLTGNRDCAWIGVGGTGLRSGLARRVTRLLELSRHPNREVLCRRPGLLRLTTLGVFAAAGLAGSAWPAGQSGGVPPRREGWQTSLAGRVWRAMNPGMSSTLMAQADTTSQAASDSSQQQESSTRDLFLTGGWPAFAAGNPEPEPLHTRAFKVDTRSLGQALTMLSGQEQPGSPTDDLAKDAQTRGLRRLFAAAGVDFASTPGKTLIWNDRNGLMMARATKGDLATIEQVLSVLNASPPQITIDVKFAEIDDGQEGARAFYKLMGMVPPGTNFLRRTTAVAPQDPAVRPVENGGVRLQSTFQPTLMEGVLNPAQFRLVVRALEQQRGVNVLSCPKVTTESSRQAQIKSVSVKYVVTKLDRSKEGKPQPVAEPMEFGPILDVVPNVNADGRTIHLTVNATVNEFLGYDLEAGERFDPQNPVPLPKIRLAQAFASAIVWDGQTMVLSPGSFEVEQKSNEAPYGTHFPFSAFPTPAPSTKTRKTLVIFVTPTIIDPAGNRVHPSEEPGEEPAAPAPVPANPRP